MAWLKPRPLSLLTKMKLYSFIHNEKRIEKRLGSNKELRFDYWIEKPGHNWQDGGVEKILGCLWIENDKPVLHIELPDNWGREYTNSGKVLRFSPQGQ